MPTWTEQGDLLFAIHAGHGEFPKIVLAPGDNDEMFELTMKAFDLADIYQVPVIVMSDMLLSESHRSLSKDLVEKHIKEYKPNRGKQINSVDQSPYLRYRITDDGISPHLIPGAEGAYYQSNSYEHLEDGHTTEEALDRINQVDKRARKTQTYLKSHFSPPPSTEIWIVRKSFFLLGDQPRGPVREAQRLLEKKEKDRPSSFYPPVSYG